MTESVSESAMTDQHSSINNSNNSNQILVRVRPSQSAYFAGERFECSIEFAVASSHTQNQIQSQIQSTVGPTSTVQSPVSSAFSASPLPVIRPSSPVHGHDLQPAINFNPFQSNPRLGLIGNPCSSDCNPLPSPSQDTPDYHPKYHSSNLGLYSLSRYPTRHLNLPNSVDLGYPTSRSSSSTIHQELDPIHQELDPSHPSPSHPSPSHQRIPDPPSSPPPDPIRPHPSGPLSSSPQRKFSTPCPPSHPWAPPNDTRRASLFGSRSGSSAPPHRLSFPRPESAVLGWTYCQLEGFFEIDDSLVDPAPFAPLRTPRTRGGGQLVPDSPGQGWVAWLLSGARPDQKRSPRRFPVFQNPISLLDVDIRLAPGETRSYSFAIDLPIGLPPSHRGKAIRFGYELVVGTNCLSREPASAGPTPRFSPSFLRPPPSPAESPSQILRVPVRVFNHVYVNAPPPSYDLLQPVIHNREMATTARVGPADRQRTTTGGASQGGLASLEAYAAQLLAGGADAQQQAGGEALEGGCRTAVEIVSRAARKVTFDINQDGRLVAQLALAKAVYRLGETVEGTVELAVGRARVLRLAISLETVERLASWAGPGGPARRVHAEQEELVLDTARTSFALVVPSEAAPEFDTSALSLHWVLRLRLQFAPATPPPRAHLRTGSVAPNNYVASLAGLHTRAHSVAAGCTSTSISPPFIHLMVHSASQGTFKAVPDLGYVPVLYGSCTGKKQAVGGVGVGGLEESKSEEQVLVPVKIETVECEVPVRIVPGNTVFRPGVYRIWV